MERILLVVLLTSIFIVRRFFLSRGNGLLSYCLLLGLSAMEFFQLFSLGPLNIPIGQYGSYFKISILTPLAILLFLRNKRKYKNIKPYKIVFSIFCVFCIVSYINPNNIYRSAVLIPFLYYCQLFLFIIVIRVHYSSEEILSSLFEAVACWTILEFILTICYPIMGMEGVASLFRGDNALEGALRRDNYASAVGTFVHPGGLAFVCSCYTIFYLSLFFSDFRKKETSIYLGLSIFAVLFTYSRSSYVALFASSFMLYLLFKSNRDNFLKKIICYSLVGILFVILFSTSSIISDLFMGSDSDDQVSNRLIHYTIGLDIFTNFPLLGTGINNHVYYMNNYVDIKFFTGGFHDFFIENPIHNVHLIMLVETGLVGFLVTYYLQIRLLLKMYNSIHIDRFVYGGPICAICIMIFCFVYGFFGWSFYNISVQTPIIILLCFLWNNKDLVTEKRKEYKR